MKGGSRKLAELVERLEEQGIDKEAVKNIEKLTEQLAMLEVLKTVRNNLASVGQYWKWRLNALRSGGIMVESHSEMMDYGDVMELRITVKVPEESAKSFIERRRLFYRIVKILSQRGADYLEKVLYYKTYLGVFPRDALRIAEEEEIGESAEEKVEENVEGGVEENA